MTFLRYFLLLGSLIALSRATPSARHVALAKRDVNVNVIHFDDNIVDKDGDLIDPEAEFLEEINFATTLARSALNALHNEFITDHPAFQAIFGPQWDVDGVVAQLQGNFQRIAELFSPSNGREVRVALYRGALSTNDGHTFASVSDDDVLDVWGPFWTATRRSEEIVPVCVTERTVVGNTLDAMVSRASIILHELFHLTYIGHPPLWDQDTTPVERSGGAAVLQMARDEPAFAINNPDSLMFFAIAMHYNIFLPDPQDPVRFAPIDLGLGFDVDFGDTELYRDPLAGSDAPPGAAAYWGYVHPGSGLKA